MHDIKKILRNIEKLQKLTPDQWDKICKNCGMCCLTKIDEDNKIYYSNFSCKNFNLETKKCNCYGDRLKNSDCQKITMKHIIDGRTIPDMCAYVEYVFGRATFQSTIDWSKTQNIANLSFEDYDKIINDTIPSSVYWSARHNLGDSAIPGYSMIKSHIMQMMQKNKKINPKQ